MRTQGTATIIVTDKPISSTKREIAGMQTALRTSSNVTFGVLSLIDPETNKVMGAKHPTIKSIAKQVESR